MADPRFSELIAGDGFFEGQLPLADRLARVPHQSLMRMVSKASLGLPIKFPPETNPSER